ncbi:DNA repair protein RadC [Lysinibacillus fusiformis]|uniref:JAB domain-containing protein n=1 Tax=Lysinibacillus fusiformis TaxID=28031 RepID=UPI001966EA8A|nr:JAB domain-containing protein [Lysinibacillus fusiformis]QSB12302.1 DNA repair protein RadC [Lysinibacillus fusiformis]
MAEKQKKVPAKRIQLVDVVLERKGSQLFEGRRVRSPEDAANIIRDFIGDSDREKFVVLCLSTKNEPTALQVVHTGSINASIVHPRDVLKVAVISNSASILVAHNHPSNDTTPSPEDIEVTKRLVEAGQILGIDVIDHLILASNSFRSLKESGYM